MKKVVELLSDYNISCTVRHHSRARNLRLTVTREGKVFLTVPRRVSLESAKLFFNNNIGWIIKKLAVAQENRKIHGPILSASDLHRYKARARQTIVKMVREVNEYYKFSYAKIGIRNQSSRWGSCSRRGNLNFNFRLFFLDEKLMRYVVTHEICHLKEMNHSDRFWKLIGETLPEYKKIRQELRGKL